MLYTMAIFFGLCAAAPLSTIFCRAAAVGTSAATMVQTIATTSTSCAGAAYADECETALQAAPFLIQAFQTYKIYSPAEMSALLSLVAYESGEFKYNRNHFPAPGRPGQGTRNLQMANYNLEYALSIPALKSQAQALAPAGTTTGLTDDTLNSILALVLPDEYAWASAAWFLTTQCDASVRTQLQSGGQAGWENYLTACVGTSATSDRQAYWTRANTAFRINIQ